MARRIDRMPDRLAEDGIGTGHSCTLVECVDEGRSQVPGGDLVGTPKTRPSREAQGLGELVLRRNERGAEREKTQGQPGASADELAAGARDQGQAPGANAGVAIHGPFSTKSDPNAAGFWAISAHANVNRAGSTRPAEKIEGLFREIASPGKTMKSGRSATRTLLCATQPPPTQSQFPARADDRGPARQMHVLTEARHSSRERPPWVRPPGPAGSPDTTLSGILAGPDERFDRSDVAFETRAERRGGGVRESRKRLVHSLDC